MDIIVKAHYSAVFERYHERFMERVPVSITEIEPSDAPIAFSCRFGSTRWLAGRHYRSYQLSNARSSLDGSTDGRAILSYIREHPSPLAGGYTPAQFCGGKPGNMLSGYFDFRSSSGDRIYSNVRYPEVETSDSRRIALDGVDRFRRDCFLCDGKLWVACAEPRIVHQGDWFVDFRRWDTAANENDMNAVRPSIRQISETFAVDDDDVMSHPNSSVLPHRIGSFRIHIPDSILWDRASASLVMACRILVDDHKDSILDLPPAIGEPVFRMHCELYGMSDDDIDRDHLSHLLNEYIISAASHIGSKAEDLANILENWNSNPITIKSQRPFACVR